MNEMKRFEKKFIPEPNSGCWLWTANVNYKGYGQFVFDGVDMGAHRASYRIYIGNIPQGMCVLHRCDVPCCVNPAHLFLGTIIDNNLDKKLKGREGDKKGEKNGRAKLTFEQVQQIKKRYECRSPKHGGVVLAKEYGVSKGLISHIIRGRLWNYCSGGRHE